MPLLLSTESVTIPTSSLPCLLLLLLVPTRHVSDRLLCTVANDSGLLECMKRKAAVEKRSKLLFRLRLVASYCSGYSTVLQCIICCLMSSAPVPVVVQYSEYSTEYSSKKGLTK